MKIQNIAIGGLAGLAGTAAMTAVFVAARAVGALDELPPTRITRAAVKAALGASRFDRGLGLALATTASHIAYGATMGSAYSVLAGRRTRGAKAQLAEGALFGIGLWAASYAGWVPAAGILPPPQRDQKTRQATLVAAHLVYGTVTAYAARRLEAAAQARLLGSKRRATLEAASSALT